MKAFLSHSSKDKDFVERIAESLTTNNCVYDKFSFEEAAITAEEIVRTLEESTIFVFFISENSLKSKWVQDELKKAHELMELGSMYRILPIIISSTITYDDALIPQWLKDNYNIQPIRKTTKVVHRIKQELIRLSWKIDQLQEKKDKFFVGRNQLIDTLEGVYRDNFYPPFCIIASGINGIGRKSLLHAYMQKVSITDGSKIIPRITLDVNESIEDLILKLDNLGLTTQEIDIAELVKMERLDKSQLLFDLLLEIQEEKEVIFIDDVGCIVLPDGTLNEWFRVLFEINNTSDKKLNHMILGIASKYRLRKNILLELNNKLYAINVPALEKKEISWLFKSYLEIKDIELSENEFKTIKDLLVGHPEQIMYAVDMIDYDGYENLYDNTYLLADFTFQRVSHLINSYKENPKAKSLLAMLSKFDFIDYELLNEIIGDDEQYKELIVEFISISVLDQIGFNKESLRMNNAIRDAIRRSDWKESDDLSKKIKLHVEQFIETYETEEKTLSDYFYSIQEVLKNNPEKIDLTTVIPSHLLKTIANMYDTQKKWRSVINLAEKVLYDSYNTLDIHIENQIRKYLCLAYIRNGNGEELLREVQKIHDSSHNFLLGFYYRTVGRYEDAIKKLKISLEQNPRFVKAKRELVQSYMSIHDYDTALELAEQNYDAVKQNPYLFQAYAVCLIKTNTNGQNNSKIGTLFTTFKEFGEDSSKAREMFKIEHARYLSQRKDSRALDEIQDAIAMYPTSIYPKIARFDICDKLSNIQCMEQALDDLKSIKDNLPTKTIIDVNEAILNAKKGQKDIAILKIKQLRNYPEKSKELLIERLDLDS